MTRAELRSQAASLLWEVRKMGDLRGSWTRREWYKTCRHTVAAYQRHVESFHKAGGTWQE